MAQVISLRVRIQADGTAVLDRTAAGVDRLGREADETAAATRRMSAAQDGSALSARRLLGVVSGLVGAGTLGLLVRKSYQYNQELESTKIGIAGLLSANREYLGTQDQWAAALADSSDLLRQIQVEALKTKATVPQLGDTFATTFGAVTAQALKATNDEIMTMSTRLMQVGNAFDVIPEQMRQEVNSLIGAMVTEDSIIARRLGLDNKSIKEMQRNGTFVAELIKRTESYAKAAEAQSNTLAGKLTNTREMIVSTFAQALSPVGEKMKVLLDDTFGWFARNGGAIITVIQRIVAAVSIGATKAGEWIRQNQDLIGNVLVLAGAVAGVQAAVLLVDKALLIATSSATKFAVALIAVALLYEGLRKLGPIEIGGSTVAGYFSAFATGLTGIVWAIVEALTSVIGLAGNGLRSLVMNFFKVFGSAIRGAGDVLGIDAMKAAGANMEKHFAKWAGNFGDYASRTIDHLGDVGEAVVEATKKAFDATELPSLGELAKDNIGEALQAIDEMLPRFDALGKKIGEKLFPSVSKGTGKTAAGDAAAAKAAEQLDALRDQYEKFINDYRGAAGAGGDPLAEELAKIEAQREDAIARFAALQEKLAKALGIKFDRQAMQDDFESIMAAFDLRRVEAAADSLDEINKRTLASAKSRFEQETEYAVEEQRRQAALRIAMIDDAGERELAIRLASIEEWFEAERGAILRTIDVEVERNRMLGNLDVERRRREEFAADEVKRLQAEQLVGTREWARQMAREIGTIPEQVTRAIGGARLELSGFFSGLLDDLVTSQADLGQSFEDLVKGLGRTWSKMLGEMLQKTIVSGQSIVTQLKAVWQQLNGGNPMTGGWGDLADAGLAGAGMGAAIGGAFGGPNNYGAEGGMIGGALGAIIGAIVTGGAGTGWGAVIGSAIGTAIGTMIQRGEDQIRVEITNGVVRLTENGISAEAARDLRIQITRRVKEETDAWRDILDLFPESVQEALANLPPPSINLSGGVENGDITDENALGALGDFLGNDLPRAAFAAYSESIRTALRTMGVHSDRIRELFLYWGTLQGQELQDAVRLFAVTLIEATEMRDLLDQPFEAHLDEARRRTSATPMTAMQDITDQIADIVEAAADLADVDDIVAAQQRVTALERQRYEMMIQYLQRIDAIQHEFLASIDAQREAVNLAGMDDQGKMDYFYSQLGSLYDQLRFATDPEEIRRITQQMNQYISQALGLDPDNEENRLKLLQILRDMEVLGNAGLEAARKAAEAAAEEARALQQEMLDVLRDIRDAVDDDDPGSGDDDDDDDEGGGESDTTPPLDPEPDPIGQTLTEISEQQAKRFEEMFDVETRIAASLPKPSDFGDAVREALSELDLEVVSDEPIELNLGEALGRLTSQVQRQLRLRVQRNPDTFTPRT